LPKVSELIRTLKHHEDPNDVFHVAVEISCSCGSSKQLHASLQL
jgi:hypothetical protein